MGQIMAFKFKYHSEKGNREKSLRKKVSVKNINKHI